VASEEKETARNENGLSLEEATSEIMAQGGLPFSGAR
jgi:hypothetical protein